MTPPRRKGVRQAQSVRVAESAMVVTAAATPAASNIPAVEPKFATLPARPRRFCGAASTRYVTESTNSTDRESLKKPHTNQQDWRPYAESTVSWQKTDGDGRDAHQ